MQKFKVIVKKIESPCYNCSSTRRIFRKKNKCKVCKGTGKYINKYYYHIIGNVCYGGDTLK